jgi:glycosyltransferase involved in cell wall biosynthesis
MLAFVNPCFKKSHEINWCKISAIEQKNFVKVVHLSQTDLLGGASISAYRMHAALSKSGVDSSLLVWQKVSQDNSVIAIRTPSEESASSIAIRNVYIENNRTHLSNTHFSLSLQGLNLSQHPLLIEADIIHLHWIPSLLTPRFVGEILKMGKPVFWTLHDVNPFTGGCHFPAGCHEFEEACESCAQLKNDPFHLPAAVLRDKEALWDLSRLTLICPSHWIEKEARSSRVFRNHPGITTLPYCIDTGRFRRTSQADARRQLELKATGPVIMIAAENGNEKRKGFAEVFRALQQCCENDDFLASRPIILQVGRAHEWLDSLPIPILDLGWVDSEERLSLIFAASDFFVLPSREDNLPNMAIEAASCGLPICGFDIGGLPDIIKDGETGFLATLDDTKGLAGKILLLTLDEERRAEMSDAAAEHASKTFGTASVIPLMVEQYEKAINRMESLPISKEEIQSDENSPGPSVSALLPAIAAHCEGGAILLLNQEVKHYQQICAERQDVINEQSAEIEMLRRECDSRLEIINRQKDDRSKIRKWWKK